MNRRRHPFLRVCILAAVVVTGIILHDQGHRRSTVTKDTEPTADAAAALRTLTHTASPDKPWIDHLADFTATHPGRWVVGRCAKPCLSPVEANTAATTDAAQALDVLAHDQLNPSRGNESWLSQQLLLDVQSGELTADQLPEKFTRPYAALYTQTILLDASPAKLDPLLHRLQGQLQMRDAKKSALQIGAIGLVAVSWFGYLLINAITRGYFSLRLQLLAGTISALAAAVLLGAI